MKYCVGIFSTIGRQISVLELQKKFRVSSLMLWNTVDDKQFKNNKKI
jgi:hypothetical protein